MWVATGWYHNAGGVLRYDGDRFEAFTTADGLAHYVVHSIQSGPDGALWFATGGGVSRYDGQTWTTLTKADGLVDDDVRVVFHDSDGVVWFGTSNGGVSGFDGTAWTVLDTRDGLAGDKVKAIHEDAQGYLWFGTSGGLTRYRKNKIPPIVRIQSVTTARAEYTDFQAPLSIRTGERITLSYSATDFKTTPEKQQYRYRIKERDDTWSLPTTGGTSDVTIEASGRYTIEVQAIDRDLNYSEPASVVLRVGPPWYLNGWITVPFVGVILALLVSTIVYGRRYAVQRHEAQRLRDQMLQQERQKNAELQTAYEELHTTQDQLIQSEKLAALGHLVAGVAHEINTPLGAVQSSNANINHALEDALNNLPTLFQILSPEQQTDFLALLQRAQHNDATLTAREKRQVRKHLTQTLQAAEIEQATHVADTLVDMGLYGEVEPFLSLLRAPQRDMILSTAYSLVRLQVNQRTIATAVKRASRVVQALNRYARIEAGGRSVQANVIELIETVLTLYQSQLKQGVDVVRSYEADPELRCFADELTQVWSNLIQNALQAMS